MQPQVREFSWVEDPVGGAESGFLVMPREDFRELVKRMTPEQKAFLLKDDPDLPGCYASASHVFLDDARTNMLCHLKIGASDGPLPFLVDLHGDPEVLREGMYCLTAAELIHSSPIRELAVLEASDLERDGPPPLPAIGDKMAVPDGREYTVVEYRVGKLADGSDTEIFAVQYEGGRAQDVCRVYRGDYDKRVEYRPRAEVEAARGQRSTPANPRDTEPARGSRLTPLQRSYGQEDVDDAVQRAKTITDLTRGIIDRLAAPVATPEVRRDTDVTRDPTPGNGAGRDDSNDNDGPGF